VVSELSLTRYNTLDKQNYKVKISVTLHKRRNFL